MKKLALFLIALAGLAGTAAAQNASCRVTTAAPTYSDGTAAPLSCETDGDLRTTAGAGGGGDATAANQTTMIGHVDGVETLIGTTNTNTGASTTALQIMDDWDETNRAAVNLIASQVGVVGGAGAVGANTLRTTLGSDDPAVASLSVIDDWDETNRAAVNLISGQVGIAAGAGAVGATVPRMTLASDDPAVASLGVIESALGGTLEVKILDSSDVALDYNAPNDSTPSSVGDAVSSTTCLASETTRQGAMFYNDSASVAYLLVDEGTASATNFTVKMAPDGYYELQVLATGVYTDDVKCIWASDAGGSMRVTQIIP